VQPPEYKKAASGRERKKAIRAWLGKAQPARGSADAHLEADRTFDAIDTNKDGVISAEELQTHLGSIGYAAASADKMFELLDANADGSISRNELRNAFKCYDDVPSMQEVLRRELDLARIHAEADAFFGAVDANGDGVVTAAELRQKLSAVGYESADSDKCFELLGANRDGEVSRDELRRAFVRYEDPTLRLALSLGDSEADAIFARIDSNGDGEISKQELRAYVETVGYPAATADTIFATLDVNGDGRVTREELRNGYVRFTTLREALGLQKPAAPSARSA